MNTLCDKENLENIEAGLQRIDVLFTELQNDTRDKILNCHAKHYSLNHCIRWGLQAVKEILDDDNFWEETSKDKRDMDYRYEIFDENSNLIDDGYVCLDSAIEYALENDGYRIIQTFYYLDENGHIDLDDYVVDSPMVMWRREDLER